VLALPSITLSRIYQYTPKDTAADNHIKAAQ
jgi:hypothetical protein